MKYHYWIYGPVTEVWIEVSKSMYVHMEREAGFNNTLGEPDEPATSYFANGSIEGRITLGPEPLPRVPTMDEIREHYKLDVQGSNTGQIAIGNGDVQQNQ